MNGTSCAWNAGRMGTKKTQAATKKQRTIKSLYSAAKDEYKPDDGDPAKDRVMSG